jgi:hypothetical protein
VFLKKVSWDILIPAGGGLLVIILVVVWPVVSDVPIDDGFLDVYISCTLHVVYIYIQEYSRVLEKGQLRDKYRSVIGVQSCS